MPVIREKRQFGSVRSVGVVKMDTGEGRKYSRIADAAQQLTNLAVNEMARISESTAKQSAEELASSQITTINPKTGKPEALDWIGNNRFIGKTAANAYARVVSDRFQKEIDNQIKERANRIALQYENDPYSVEKYEDQMTAYLEGLAKGSEENGKRTAYTNYILDQGTQFLTATKLSMMQERNRRERNKLTASIVERNEEDKKTAYDFGLQGRALDIEDFIESSTDRNLDGEASGLIKSGAARSHSSLMETAYVDGSVSRIMSKLDGRPVDRANVILALTTENTDDLPEDIQAEVEALLPFIEFGNRDAVVGHAASLSTRYSAVEVAQKRERTELRQESAKEYIPLYKDLSEGLENQTARDFDFGINSSNINDLSVSLETGINKLIAAQSAIENNQALDQSDKESLQKDNRKKVLRNLLIVAANDNYATVDSLQKSILRRYKSSDLTPKQSMIVDKILDSGDLYDANEDEKFVREYLNSIEGDEAKQKEELDAINLKLQIDAVSLDFRKGNINLSVLNGIRNQIASASFLSGPEKESQNSKIQRNIANGYVNAAAISSSTEMNQLYLYIDNSGEVKSFDGVEVPLNVQEVGNRVLGITNADDIENILSTISQRTSKLRSNEQDIINANKEAQEQIDLFFDTKYGSPNIKTKKHRDYAKQYLKDQGIAESALDPNSENPQYYDIARNVIPQDLYEALKGLRNPAVSLTEQQANTVLNHFDRLTYDPDAGSRRRVNRFGDLLGEDFAFLKEVSNIRKIDNSRNVLTIIADLNATYSNKTVAEANFKNVFPDQTARDFLSNKYDDRKIVEELTPLANFYAKIGKNKNDIIDILDDIVETNYVESEYIIDPQMTLGDLKKSRFSLARMFPNQEEQKEFLRIVEENLLNLGLKDNYSIFPFDPSETVAATGPRRLAGVELKRDETDKKPRRVYLVPFEHAGSPQYYTYFINPETNEAEPLIYQKDGKDFWPMFDMSTTEDWRKADVLKRFEDDQAQAKKNKLMFDGVKVTLGQTAEAAQQFFGIRIKTKDDFITESNSE